MKVFIITVLVLVFGYFGFDRYQQLEKAKVAAAEAARQAAEEDKRRSDLAARVAAEERKRQEEEDELIAAEARHKAAQKQKVYDADAEKKRREAQALLAQQRQAKQQEIDRKTRELQYLNSQLSAVENQIRGGSAARASQYTDQRIQNLQQQIASWEAKENTLKREVISRQQNARMMQCYAHCVLRHHVDCRVQMGNETKKTLNGTYYKQCHIPQHNRVKRNPRCKYYDKNGYWFVRFQCNTHRNNWTKELIARYKYLYEFKREEFVGGNARRQLRECQNTLSRRRTELRNLQNQKRSAGSSLQPLQNRRNQLNNQINLKQQEIDTLRQELNRIR